MILRLTLMLFVCLACALTSACAPSSGPKHTGTTLERQWPEQPLLIRHRVQVDIPGMSLPAFDGVMLAPSASGAKEVRVLGLGGMGLTLFDMTVREKDHTATVIHPSLRRANGIDAQIARCIRAIWFASLPPQLGAQGDAPIYESYGNIVLKHTTYESKLRMTEEDGSPTWNVRFTPSETQPATITFTSKKPEYTVRIHCVSVSKER